MNDSVYGELVANKAVEGKDFGYVAYPGTEGAYLAIVDTFVVSADAEDGVNAMKFLETVADPATSLAFNKVKGSVPIRSDVDVASLPPYQQQASKSLWEDQILLSITHGELLPSAFQQAMYDAVATFVQSKNARRVHRHPAELDRRSDSGPAMTDSASGDDGDAPLFLVVTIRPRLDRLAEAEAQLQSMRRNTLQEPGCVFMHLRPTAGRSRFLGDARDVPVPCGVGRAHARSPTTPRETQILEGLLREPSELRLSTRSDQPAVPLRRSSPSGRCRRPPR